MLESWLRRWSCRLVTGRVAIVLAEVVAVVLRPRRARRLADAVEVLALGAVLPVLTLGAAELRAVDRGRPFVADTVAAALRRPLALALAGVLGTRDPLGQRLEGRRRFLLRLEKRVLLEHLLDFLVQLERRELQQPDRLLQLRRQRQMLRQPDLKRRLHDMTTRRTASCNRSERTAYEDTAGPPPGRPKAGRAPPGGSERSERGGVKPGPPPGRPKAGRAPSGGSERTRERGGPMNYMRKFSPRYTLRTSALATISAGVPSASTRPSLMM